MPKVITIERSTIDDILTKLDLVQQEIHRLNTAIHTGDQSWYWSETWQVMEQEADADLKAGDYQDYGNIDELISDFHTAA